jgi:hypothetical protein
VEILVGIDPDDTSYADSGIAWEASGVELVTFPERYGYTRLHDYLNPLAARAKGEWCFWMNDDMLMRTDGWDTVIAGWRPAILWPSANHVHHANIAPAWPRSWSDANGMVTPTSHMDTWLQRVGERLGRHDSVPIEIIHDRFDITGNHRDQTYAEGREPLGPEGMVGVFPSHLVDAYADKCQQVIDAGRSFTEGVS